MASSREIKSFTQLIQDICSQTPIKDLYRNQDALNLACQAVVNLTTRAPSKAISKLEDNKMTPYMLAVQLAVSGETRETRQAGFYIIDWLKGKATNDVKKSLNLGHYDGRHSKKNALMLAIAYYDNNEDCDSKEEGTTPLSAPHDDPYTPPEKNAKTPEEIKKCRLLITNLMEMDPSSISVAFANQDDLNTLDIASRCGNLYFLKKWYEEYETKQRCPTVSTTLDIYRVIYFEIEQRHAHIVEFLLSLLKKNYPPINIFLYYAISTITTPNEEKSKSIIQMLATSNLPELCPFSFYPCKALALKNIYEHKGVNSGFPLNEIVNLVSYLYSKNKITFEMSTWLLEALKNRGNYLNGIAKLETTLQKRSPIQNVNEKISTTLPTAPNAPEPPVNPNFDEERKQPDPPEPVAPPVIPIQPSTVEVIAPPPYDNSEEKEEEKHQSFDSLSETHIKKQIEFYKARLQDLKNVREIMFNNISSMQKLPHYPKDTLAQTLAQKGIAFFATQTNNIAKTPFSELQENYLGSLRQIKKQYPAFKKEIDEIINAEKIIYPKKLREPQMDFRK